MIYTITLAIHSLMSLAVFPRGTITKIMFTPQAELVFEMPTSRASVTAMAMAAPSRRPA
jgi:hypothetical protein